MLSRLSMIVDVYMKDNGYSKINLAFLLDYSNEISVFLCVRVCKYVALQNVIRSLC